ncbi:MAG: site-2 protease family protein [Armatimonadetes bacterium]|nr:site-2 protease family protein [Armatimonadota bacterium]MBS1701341.1 site-2 protease family protein [Armatimonadota bacterium]MBS1728413.1 site-2 protease family protein [Armatimonadota bacterium]
MFSRFDPYQIVFSLLVFIPAIAIHEFCHAKFADMAGDMTPRAQGRVTLNPLAHLDPIGTIMIVISSMAGFGIGWGRPVMVNPSKMKNPRWDHFISVIMGPVSNLGLALVCAILIKSGLADREALSGLGETGMSFGRAAFASGSAFFSLYVLMSFIMNLSLFFFNLIPLGPLDGHWLVGAFLPPQARNSWYRFCHGPGMIIFLILVLIPAGNFNVIDWYLGTTVGTTMRLMLGI